MQKHSLLAWWFRCVAYKLPQLICRTTTSIKIYAYIVHASICGSTVKKACNKLNYTHAQCNKWTALQAKRSLERTCLIGALCCASSQTVFQLLRLLHICGFLIYIQVLCCCCCTVWVLLEVSESPPMLLSYNAVPQGHSIEMMLCLFNMLLKYHWTLIFRLK